MVKDSNSYIAVFTCHPDTSNEVVRGIEARVCWTQDGTLALIYVLKGEITHLQIPPPRPPRRADRLWQHTCFEAFVATKGESAYYEFNFAPSGEWAVYAFRRYREGAPLVEEGIAPSIAVESAGDSLEVQALIRVDRLPTIHPGARLRLALAAVIEDDQGMLSYWALKHPPGKPDFHHPDAFALEINAPGVGAINESPVEKR